MKKIPLLLLLYFVLIGTVCYSVFFKNNQSSFSQVENRTLVCKNDLNKNISFINNDYQNIFSNLMLDQFPFKKEINLIGTNYNSLRSDLSARMVGEVREILVKNGQVYRIGDSDYYIDELFDYDDQNKTLLENRIWNFERIYEKYGQKYNMYIYKPACANEENWFDDGYYISSGEECWNNFSSRLNGKYKLKKQELKDLDDYKKNHFKTDHHWNSNGAYIGYKDIINMINEDYEEVGNPYSIKNIKTYDYPFYGSLSLHNNNSLGYDEFNVYELDCDQDFVIYVDGEEKNQIGFGEDVFEKKDEYIYEGYYGHNEKEIKIINNSAKNDLTLLIFGDSFSNCINTDIASHFKTTYIVDTRFIYDASDVSNTTFSLDDFLKNNQVDCILWLQFYTSLYFDSACYLHIDLNY